MRGCSWLCLYFRGVSIAARPLERQHEDDSDLQSYISRPDIRPPKLELSIYDEKALLPGYIFTAPYQSLHQGTLAGTYQPFQIGPHIYGSFGELVWSGAEFTHNHNAYDFKSTLINGSYHLTMMFQKTRDDNHPGYTSTGVVLDSHYQVVNNVSLEPEFNMHEFTAIDNGNAFLKISTELHKTKAIVSQENLTIADTCACEVYTQGHELFRFCPTDGIAVEETMLALPEANKISTTMSDIFHMNSVDKLLTGDYLVSIRYTNAIYRISKQGRIVWRLGGKLTDFVQDFNFTGQHDARVVSHNSTTTIVSLFDNASADHDRISSSARSSSFKIVALYEHQTPKRAVLLKEFDRPDGQLTQLRGNGQYLPTGGAFVGWSAQSYLSEFGPNGDLLLEGRFTSTRFNSYRIFKSHFTGMPTRPPDLKAFQTINDDTTISTLCFVSWNRATEVTLWEFFGLNKGGQFESLGVAPRTGFETSFVATGAWVYVRAQARDKNGNALGESKVQHLERLHGTSGDDFTESVLDRLTIDQRKSFPTQEWRSYQQGGLFLVIIPAGLFSAWLVSARRSKWRILPFTASFAAR